MSPGVTAEAALVLAWYISTRALCDLLKLQVERGRMSLFAARKVLHVLTGLWVVPMACFIHRWWMALIPVFLIFVLMHRSRRAGAPATARPACHVLITVAAPVALILHLWSEARADLVVLAVLAMTAGDVAGALAGTRWGRHRIALTGKTWEGAAANFAFSAVTLLAAGWFLYGEPFWIPMLVVAGACALTESWVPGDCDNPAVVVVGLLLLPVLVG